MRTQTMTLAAAALLLSLGTAGAQTYPQPAPFAAEPPALAPDQKLPPIMWTEFREPSEGAYTVQIPRGWTAAGGLRRYAPSEVPTWLTVTSPDGRTQLFLGDPAVTTFFLPSQFAPEGAQIPGLHGRGATVMRYRPGAEYATVYGTRSLSGACANVQVQGSTPLPKFEDELRNSVQAATRLDAGETSFTCQRDGQNFIAAVDAGTGLVMFPGGNGAGFWAVIGLRGYLTPAASAPWAAQLLDRVTASFKLDPNFEAAVRQASEQEERQAQAANAARAAAAAQTPAPAPAPYTPSRAPAANACPDDLQQQRICRYNDGHIVVSGGCMRCISD